MTASREYKYEWDVLYLKCTHCWKWLTIDWFIKNSHKKFWVNSWCKLCNKSKRAKFYWEHREEQLEAIKTYIKENREKVNRRAREYCRKNREKINERASKRRRNHLELVRERAKNHIKARSKELWFHWKSFHNKARLYVSKYWLRPDSCSICWSTKDIVMHHPSYETFLEWKNVVFCCVGCHSKIHTWEIECPKPINLIELKKQWWHC